MIYNYIILKEIDMGTSIQFKLTDRNRKIVKIQLSKSNRHYSDAISNLSSCQIKKIIGDDSLDNISTICQENKISINFYIENKLISFINNNSPKLMQGIEGTYRGGKNDFFQSLFPYLEAFSPNFVLSIVNKYAPNAKILLEPFAGLGTAPFIFTQNGNKKAYYCEVNPIMQKLIYLKTQLRELSTLERSNLLHLLKNKISTFKDNVENCIEDKELKENYIKVFGKAEMFSQKTLNQVLKTRSYIDNLNFIDKNLACCFEIATIASLIPASNMQRAGDLRKKTIKESQRISNDLYKHLSENLSKISNGLLTFSECKNTPSFIIGDVKLLEQIPNIDADIVVTSPPYLNGTNYFRNTKLELWFIKILKNNDDLGRLRDKAITSGINDVRGIRSTSNPNIKYNSLNECLSKIDNCAYDKRIPQMIKWYAYDMENALKGTIQQLKKNGIIAIDIGDSVYCGINVPTDKLIEEILEKHGCTIIDIIKIRERFSRSGIPLKQVCIIGKKVKNNELKKTIKPLWFDKWQDFTCNLPHKQAPFNSKLWGHPYHSMCSYQGKLKPAIAKFITDTFVEKGNSMLDIFSGVGTIPFEAAIKGVSSYSFDISPAALIISRAKLSYHNKSRIKFLIDNLSEYISNNIDDVDIPNWLPNFNKNLREYFHPKTFKEIICARNWFLDQDKQDCDISLLWASTMHILHGNRPYALSRCSHPITPFSPTGDFIYKSLIEKLQNKIDKTLKVDLGADFVEGKVYNQDATSDWPQEINNLDAIITSPPFFDSTRFYSANWMRLWFAGWNEEEFKTEHRRYVEEKQKKSFDCYDSILLQSKERLKKDCPLVLHLGKSEKCNMAAQILNKSKRFFSHYDLFNEPVSDCENFGIKDKGGTTSHQYLVLY